VPARRAAHHPPPGLPRRDRPARQHAHRAAEELDRRGGRERHDGDVEPHEDHDRVQLELHLRDLPDVRDRLRHPGHPHRPAHHVPLDPTGGPPMSTQQSVLFDAPGPRARRVIMIGNVVGGIVVLGVAALVLLALGRKGQLDADLWTSLFTADAWQYYFIPGLQNTLRAAGFAIVGALVFGLVVGTGRLSQLRAVRVVSGIVVEFFRAVPVLLMMIFFYLLLGFNKVDDAPFLAVVFALVLYNGSVIAELVRSGVGNLPKGQGEAGLAIGLTPSQTLRSIQLPQALIAMLPALVSQLVVVLKDSALGQIITYNELLRAAQ